MIEIFFTASTVFFFLILFYGCNFWMLPFLKQSYIHTVASLGTQKISWLCREKHLQQIGIHCYWKQNLLYWVFLILVALHSARTISFPKIVFGFLYLEGLFLIAWSDAATGHIPNFLNYIFGMMGILSAGLYNPPSLIQALFVRILEVLSAYALFWSLNTCAKQLSRQLGEKSVMGEGDMLFFAALAAWIGFLRALRACWIGNILALALFWISQNRGDKKHVRYAPYLGYGAGIEFLYQKIWDKLALLTF